MRKLSKIFVSAILTAGILLTGCGASGEITVVSREEGSGTRGAFVELFEIEEKTADGEKVDHTTEDAVTIQSTSVMMTTVAGEENAIGYISMGSLNDTVKAVKIDGAEPTVENVKAGTYAVSRPFNIVTKEDISEVAEDFINYIMSKEGQAVVAEEGYISNDNATDFEGKNPSGKIVVAGSSSVTPVMEKLKEAYIKVNPQAEIEVQQSDSSTGVSAAIDGTCDIGMASRELKDSETSEGVKATVIAADGIAVIVNNDSEIDNLTKAQVKDIYTGAVTSWSDLSK